MSNQLEPESALRRQVSLASFSCTQRWDTVSECRESALRHQFSYERLGGLAGNQVGVYMDRQEQELRNVMARSEAASIQRSQDVLTATFKGEAFFNHDSAVLLPGGYNEVARIASVLQKYNQTQIEVAGHTDTTGSEQYNQQLSVRRAEAVKNALIQQGVNPARIVAVGYGESQPISSDHAMNRRVEIVIVPITRG